MSIIPGNEHTQLAVCAKDAARMLGIGQRKLWSLTNRGDIPHFRIGRSVRYSVPALMEWIDERTKGGRR